MKRDHVIAVLGFSIISLLLIISVLLASTLDKSISGNTIIKLADDCQETWACTSWSSCTNGKQTRLCSDQNRCGTSFEKPVESRSCDCIPNWICDPWKPDVCPTNGTIVRECEDANKCGILDNKPKEIDSCEPKILEARKELIIAILVTFIALIVGGIYIVLKNMSKEKSLDVLPRTQYNYSNPNINDEI